MPSDRHAAKPLTLRRRRFGAIALLLGGLAGAVLPAAAAELKLRLLETTDIHMSLLGWDYYQDKPTAEWGLARTAALIKAARGEVRNSMLFDNGDLIQGSPLGDQVARIQPLKAGEVHPADLTGVVVAALGPALAPVDRKKALIRTLATE